MSVLLGLGAFIGVLVLAPVDTPSRRVSRPSLPRLDQTINAVRTALMEDREIASVNIAQNAVHHHPRAADAWMWLAITADRTRDPMTAMKAAERLIELVEDPAWAAGRQTTSFTAVSDRLYRLGWGYRLIGDRAGSEARFAEAADALESEAGVRGGVFLEYNLACYRALAGEPDRAADHFARAIEAGYGRDNGWWRVDPDLDPIRSHPVFVGAGERLVEPAPARGRPAQQSPTTQTDTPANDPQSTP